MQKNDIEGLLLVNKPRGLTSFDVIQIIREAIKIKKIGHTGTLDPEAEGLLLLLIGRNATKNASLFMKQDKKYLCSVIFGYKTTSGDRDGLIIDVKEKSIEEENLLNAIEKFKGKISQKPPMFSAVHHNGKRLYQLAREGISVDIKSRDVFIYELKIISFIKNGLLKAELEISCSSGTYIRTLIEDIAEEIGTFAFISKLVRVSSGNFTLNNSVKLINLKENEIKYKIIDTKEALDEIKNS